MMACNKIVLCLKPPRAILSRLTTLRYYSAPASRQKEDLPSSKLSYFHQACDEPLLTLTVSNLVDRAVKLYSDREAVVDCTANVRKTYAEYANDIDKLATGLLALGVKKGERLGILSTNSYEWLVTQYAAARSGLILVPLNFLLQPRELVHCLQISGLKTLVCGEKVRDFEIYNAIASIIPNLGQTKPGQIKNELLPNLERLIMISDKTYPGAFKFTEIQSMGGDQESEKLKIIKDEVQYFDPLHILFTSGTTGVPKGAMLTHHNAINNAYFSGKRVGYNYPEKKFRACNTAPFFHVNGTTFASLANMYNGHCVVMASPLYNITKVLEAIQKEKITHFMGPPTMLIDIASHPQLSSYDISSIQQGYGGGYTIPPTWTKQAMKKLNLVFQQGYGSTECSLTVANMDTKVQDMDIAADTVGEILYHLETKIVGPDGKLVPFGTPGELYVRGFTTMLGYWQNEEKTRDAFADGGWFKTGDVGTLSEEGYLRIVGRLTDMIIRGGENVYPREIEDLLAEHPKIQEAHVFGVPHDRLGEQVSVWVILRQGQTMTADELKAACAGQLASYKIPTFIKFVDSVPKQLTGKVNKSVMTQQMTAEINKEK